MKKLLVLLILLLASCSFKKHQDEAVPKKSNIEELSESISSESVNTVLDAISKLEYSDIKEYEAHAALYHSALIRGDALIVEALIKKGISPYYSSKPVFAKSKNYDRWGYHPMEELNRKVSSEIQIALSNKDNSELSKLVSNKLISCVSLVSLHHEFIFHETIYYSAFPTTKSSSFADLETRQDNLISFLKTNKCVESLKGSSQKSMWMTSEILRAVYQKDGLKYSEMYRFLIDLFGNSKFAFNYTGQEKIDIIHFIKYRIEKSNSTDETKDALEDMWIRPLSIILRTKNPPVLLSTEDISKVEETYLKATNTLTTAPDYLMRIKFSFNPSEADF